MSGQPKDSIWGTSASQEEEPVMTGGGGSRRRATGAPGGLAPGKPSNAETNNAIRFTEERWRVATARYVEPWVTA